MKGTTSPRVPITGSMKWGNLSTGRRGDCIKINHTIKHTLKLARLIQYRQPNNQGLAWWEQAKTAQARILAKLEVSQETKHTHTLSVECNYSLLLQKNAIMGIMLVKLVHV